MTDNFKYILIVFNNPEHMFAVDRDPKEIKILEEIATGDVRGASCGVVNFCTFSSDKTKEDISKLFTEADIDFLLTEEKDSVIRVPDHLAKTFGLEPTRKLRKSGNEKPEKLSLEDQLEEAKKNEQWEIAAAIRDRIEKAKTEPKVLVKEKSSIKKFLDEL